MCISDWGQSGLAFECNIWSIRIDFGDGYISSNTALDICTIFHNAKKISQNNDPDPTVTNNSYGFTSSTGNISNFFYAHGYRGTAYSYQGTGFDNILPGYIMVPKETISIFHIIQVELVKMLVTVDQDNMLQLQLQVPQLIHRQRVQLPQV